MKPGSINLERLYNLLLNQYIDGFFAENYLHNASGEMTLSEEVLSLPIIRLSILLNENPLHSIIIEGNSDGETLRFRNGQLEEVDLGKYGCTKIVKLSQHYIGEVVFIKAYLSGEKPVSLELTFKGEHRLSITNWGDELKVLDKPFLDEEKINDFITPLNIFTYGIDPQI